MIAQSLVYRPVPLGTGHGTDRDDTAFSGLFDILYVIQISDIPSWSMFPNLQQCRVVTELL